jgi:hypothetical protein
MFKSSHLEDAKDKIKPPAEEPEDTTDELPK